MGELIDRIKDKPAYEIASDLALISDMKDRLIKQAKGGPEIICLRCGKDKSEKPHGHCSCWGKTWARHLWGPDGFDGSSREG